MLPLQKTEKIMQFLKLELPKLHLNSDIETNVDNKKRYIYLQQMVHSYFGEKIKNPLDKRVELTQKISRTKDKEEFESLKNDILKIGDDELSFTYIVLSVAAQRKLTSDDVELIAKLRKSPNINSDIIKSFDMILDIATNGESAPATYALYYFTEAGCSFGGTTSRNLAFFCRRYCFSRVFCILTLSKSPIRRRCTIQSILHFL